MKVIRGPRIVVLFSPVAVEDLRDATLVLQGLAFGFVLLRVESLAEEGKI